MIANTRQPPCSTSATANWAKAPSQNAIEMRIATAVIDPGRSERMKNPSSSHRMPTIMNSHQVLA